MTLPTPLYSDNHLLVVQKPAGMLIQKDSTGDESLLDAARSYLKVKFDKPGNVYLGLVHRLDRPASGVVVFARTSKAAGRLSDQFRRRAVKKTYWALVKGKPPRQGNLKNWMRRDGVHSLIVSDKDGKMAELSYRRLHSEGDTSLLEIDLGTGRHHQIRVQLAHIGFPIIGDFRYGSKVKFPNRTVALHARSISVTHPVRSEAMTFVAPLESSWPKAIVALQSEWNKTGH